MWSIWVKFMKKVKNLATLSLKIILYPAKLMMNIRGTSKGTTLPTLSIPIALRENPGQYSC